MCLWIGCFAATELQGGALSSVSACYYGEPMDPNWLVDLMQQARFDGYVAAAVMLLKALTEAFAAHPWILIGLIVLVALSIVDRKTRRGRRRRPRF